MARWGRRLAVGALLLLLAGIGHYAGRWQPLIDDVLKPPTPDPAIGLRLYFADGDAQCVLVETRTIVLTGFSEDDRSGVAAGGAPALAGLPVNPATWPIIARAALEELARGPETPGLWPTIPPGARVLDVTLSDRVAIVNYSLELRRAHGGGSAGEMLTVASIAGTLSEFPFVDEVHILLEGAVVETLVGHLALDRPIRIDPDALARGRICWDGIQ